MVSRAAATALVGTLAVVAALAIVSSSGAASYDCATAFDVDTCNAVDTLNGDVLLLRSDVQTLQDAGGGVALSPDARALLEVAAWGVWFVFGGVVFLMAAPILTRAFQWWRDA